MNGGDGDIDIVNTPQLLATSHPKLTNCVWKRIAPTPTSKSSTYHSSMQIPFSLTLDTALPPPDCVARRRWVRGDRCRRRPKHVVRGDADEHDARRDMRPMLPGTCSFRDNVFRDTDEYDARRKARPPPACTHTMVLVSSACFVLSLVLHKSSLPVADISAEMFCFPHHHLISIRLSSIAGVRFGHHLPLHGFR
jgi:hypothetical protein